MSFRRAADRRSLPPARAWRRSLNAALLAGASAAALLAGGPGAQARDILRGNPAASPVANVSAAQAAAMQQARGMAQRAANSLARSTQALQALQAAQAAARNMALTAPSQVPNGLGAGGLVVAPGAGTTEGVWTGADLPTQAQKDGRTEVTIRQNEQKAILNWESFNVGRDTTVKFDQSQGNTAADPKGAQEWIALNRVTDPSGKPSQILGQIKAEGQVYVINRNGIIFGGASQVNVRSLVASSLSLSDEQFRAGINKPRALPGAGGNDYGMPQFGDHATQAPNDYLSLDNPNQTPALPIGDPPGDVRIEAGAQIEVASGGKALIFGPRVSNAGTIKAPDGQVILAAGEQVWLSTDMKDGRGGRGVRGLDVAVSAPSPYLYAHYQLTGALGQGPIYNQFTIELRDIILPAMQARAESVGYQVSNTGIVQADRGNITLQARQIAQNGALVASTALNNREGSIRLRAWGQGLYAYSSSLEDVPIQNWSAGTLILGPDSVTTIMPDSTDKTEIEQAALATRYRPGWIEMRGDQIAIEDRASVIVPAGTISIVASKNPNAYEEPIAGQGGSQDGSRIYLGRDAYLSVAGLQDVLVAMERNFVTGEFRINELRDSPLYRDSWLRGQKGIVVDRRVSGQFTDPVMSGVEWVAGSPGKWVGTPLGDFTGWLGVGKTDLGELSTKAGTIGLKAGGSVITREGSLFDVAGGSVRFGDGWNRTTKLLGADGRIYDIGKATSDMIYVGIAGQFTRHHSRWGVSETWSSPLKSNRSYEKGYTEGREAGSIQIFAGEAYVLEGGFWGGVISGERQIASGKLAKAGTLKLGDSGDEDRTWLISDLIVTADPHRLPEDFGATSPVPTEFYHPETEEPFRAKTTWLDPAILNASGMARLDFNINKSLTIAEDAVVDLVPGSTLAISFNVNTQFRTTDVAVDGTIRVPGGQVNLGGINIALGSTAVIDVSGQWVNDLLDPVPVPAPAINGGSIQLGSSNPMEIAPGAILNVSGGGWYSKRTSTTPSFKAGDGGSIQLGIVDSEALRNVDLRGFAAGSGGTLQINTAAPVQLGGAVPTDASIFHIPETLFGDRGFRGLGVSTSGNIVIPDGAQIVQRPVNIDLSGVYLGDIASGTPITEIGPVRMLPVQERIKRTPSSIGLSSQGYDIVIGTGVLLQTDVRGTVSLNPGSRTVPQPGGSGVMVSGDLIVRGTVDAPAGSIGLESGGRILLEETARLLARGVPVVYDDGRVQRAGSILPGGSISLDSAALALQPGSLIDVSGAAAALDRQMGTRTLTRQVASNGGSIEISGAGLIAATMLGRSGGPNAVGGTLSVKHAAPSSGSPRQQFEESIAYFDPDCLGLVGNGVCVSGDWQEAVGFDWVPLLRDWGFELSGTMILTREMHDALPQSANFTVSQTAEAPSTGALDPAAFGLTGEAMDNFQYVLGLDLRTLFIEAQQFTPLVLRPSSMDGGFADLSLTASSAIHLDDVAISAGRSLTVSAALKNVGSAGSRLSAPLVSLGGPTVPGTGTRTGSLVVSATTIDLGGLQVVGFADTTLRARDIRILSEIPQLAGPVLIDVDGRLTVAGQLYPMTGVVARVRASERLTIVPNGEPSAPLSAAAKLTLEAPVIEQNGSLRVPFGTIEFKAGERLVLGAGSVTSVSGDGLVLPYGWLSNNEHWMDPLVRPDWGVQAPALVAPPDKRISFEAPTVELAEGSTVDIRGGGDLQATEFVPGPGGSRDILAAPGIYAIVPAYRGSISPGGGVAAGETIWLAGGNGLAAGWYTLLPARYAALPGAYAVMPAGGGSSLAPAGLAGLPDGSVVMSGYRGNSFSGTRDEFYSSWRVMSGQVLRQYTEYNEALANQFFASDAFKLSQYRLTGIDVVTPRLPMDGGSVVFRATQELILDGGLLSRAAEGGRGGLVDIAGAKIAIVGAGKEQQSLIDAGYLVIDSTGLSNFGAASLLIGGTRTGDAQGLRLNVLASDVVLRNDEATRLFGSEIILAASDSVAIEAGSVLAAQGEMQGGAGDLIVSPQAPAVYADPDGWDDGNPADDVLVTPSRDWGAIVRVSNGDAVKVVRENVDITVGGIVSVGANARIDGGKSLLIDATRTTNLASSAVVSGEALSLAGGRISFGGGSEGLVLDRQALVQLSDTKHLTLRSYTTVDFHSSVDLGGAGLSSVTFDAAGLVGQGASDITVTGQRVALVNSGSTPGTTPASGTGTLALIADELVLGAGDKTVMGFERVALTGSRRIRAEGNGTLDVGVADLVMTSPLVTGQGGAFQSVKTGGTVEVTGAGTAPTSGLEESLGSRWSLSGSSIVVSGTMAALGGAFDLTATGGDLILASGATLNVGGFEKRFFDVVEYGDAGRISLTAVGGSVRVQEGVVLDLSGADGGGNAGTLSVTASGGGTVILDGQMAAQAAAGYKAGSFAMDVAALPNFGALSQRLNEAGFFEARQFRIRSGDVVIDGSTSVRNFSLTTDNGTATLAGTIDARSAFGGRIAITGGRGLVMLDSARLQSGATGELGGGRVSLEAARGQLDIRGGVIDVAGADGGRVRLRAPRSAGHDEIAVAGMKARIVGARSAVLEGVSVYQSDSVDAVKAQAIAEAARFSAHAEAITRRLGDGIVVMPGIEIRSAGDLTVGSDWNLQADFGAGMREGGLTLRAGGNLIVNGHISDGFDLATRDGVLLDTASWDLRLVAGADLGSANALAVKPIAGLEAGKGSLQIGDAAAGKQVRTGSGDIDVRAARDVKLAHNESVIYTAGRKDLTTYDDFVQYPSWRYVNGQFIPAPDPVYAIGGGNLDIVAQGDIEAIYPTGTGQLFTHWLYRQGNVDADGLFVTYQDAAGIHDPQQSAWWVIHGMFQHGVGALGGGNVAVSAGGDLRDLLVALPTNGRVRGGRTIGERKLLEMRNGGALSVDAGGAIRGGQYYIGRGAGTVVAGEMTTGRTLQIMTASWTGIHSGTYPLAPILAIGDASLSVRTAGDMKLQTVLDPLMVPLPMGSDGWPDPRDYGSYMTGHTDRTSLSLTSVGGDIVLGGQTSYLAQDIDDSAYDVYDPRRPSRWAPQAGDSVNLYPSKTRITALNGDIENKSIIRAMPSPQAELRLLADGNLLVGGIYAARNKPDNIGFALQTPFRPGGGTGSTTGNYPITELIMGKDQYGRILDNPDRLLLADDYEPSRFYALNGSIINNAASSYDLLNGVHTNEQSWFRAGKDIRNVYLELRNLHPTDTTLIKAGNDIINGDFTVQGPGVIALEAGRDVFGQGTRIYTHGNTFYDPNNRPSTSEWMQPIKGLPEQGASIFVMAGLAGKEPDYEAFAAAYVDPANVASMPDYLKATAADGSVLPLYLTDLTETRSGKEKTIRRGLVSFMKEMTGETLAPLAAWERFKELPQMARQQFLRRVYVQELRDAGRNQNEEGPDGLKLNGGYNRGYAAVDKLFPGKDWKGDVAIGNAMFRTMSGGDIDVFAPGGGLQVAALGTVVEDGRGLVTLGYGHINLFVRDSVTVNRSRVLTFAGGDQIIWATLGDIDAGRGAKTTRVPSAPEIVTDPDANTETLERADMSGSGIGTVAGFAEVEKGDTDLIAPQGTVNPGDAGIRVSGNLNVAALRVVNIENIEVGGEMKGVPKPTPQPTVLTSGTEQNQASKAAADAAQAGARRNNDLPSIITVEVIGYGGGGAVEGGEERRDRPVQKSAAEPAQGIDSPYQVVGAGEMTEEQAWAMLAERQRLAGSR